MSGNQINPTGPKLITDFSKVSGKPLYIVAKARQCFQTMKTFTADYAQKLLTDTSPIVIKMVTTDEYTGEETHRIGLLDLKSIQPNTNTFDDLPPNHAIRVPDNLNALLTVKGGVEAVEKIITATLHRHTACEIEGEISLDKHFVKHKEPIRVPVKLLFTATPRELTQDKKVHCDCELIEGFFPSTLITADQYIFKIPDLKQPLQFKLTQIPIDDISNTLRGMQILSRQYTSWSFLQEPSGIDLATDTAKQKPLAIRVLGGRGWTDDIGEITVREVVQPTYTLTNDDLLNISLELGGLTTKGNLNFEDRIEIERILRNNLDKRCIDTHLICDIRYNQFAPKTVKGKEGNVVIAMQGTKLNVDYDIATHCYFLDTGNIPEELLKSNGIKLVTSNHVVSALRRVQEQMFHNGCSFLMSEDKMSSCKFAIIKDGISIGTLRATDIEMSIKDLTNEETLEIFRNLNPKQFDEDYFNARRLVTERLMQNGNLDELTSPIARCTIEFNDNAPKDWRGLTTEHLGHLNLRFLGLGSSETVDGITQFYKGEGRFRLRCQIEGIPSKEIDKHLHGLLLNGQESFEIEIDDTYRPHEGNMHLIALPKNDVSGRLFFRNITS